MSYIHNIIDAYRGLSTAAKTTINIVALLAVGFAIGSFVL